MHELFTASGKAVRDLARGDILWHVLWPPVVAAALWGTVGILIWAHGLALMAQIVPQLPWVGWEWAAHWAAVFLLLAAVATLIICALSWSKLFVAVLDHLCIIPRLSRSGAAWRKCVLAEPGQYARGGMCLLVRRTAVLAFAPHPRCGAGAVIVLDGLVESAHLPRGCLD